MQISYFTENYTNGKGVFFSHVTGEVKELFEEVLALNYGGMKEEFSDVVAFFQMWLYCRYHINGSLWTYGMPSFEKFMSRRAVWNKIYAQVGLQENISRFCGNYERKEKVVAHLREFGISEEAALAAYAEIVT